MPRLSWALLLVAIVAATGTVTVITATGPEWPGLFASCDDDEGVHEGGPRREAAIDRWTDAWKAPYWVGLAVSSALALGWALTAHWRPGRRGVVALAVLAVVIGVAIAASPSILVVPAVAVAIAWNYALGFPDFTPFLAPVLCLITLGLAWISIAGLGRGGQRNVQFVLVLLLVSAWVALGMTGAPSNGAFAC